MKRAFITLLIALLFASVAMNIMLGKCVVDINHDIGLINSTNGQHLQMIVMNSNDLKIMEPKVQANHNDLVLLENAVKNHKGAILYLMQEGHTHEESR